MARYDPERIAALAAGSLDPAETAALEAEIAADPRAVAELTAQRLALAAVHQAPVPILSTVERAELRRAVATALNLEPAPVAAAIRARRRVPWRPLAVAAAALAAVVAVVPLIGLLSVGGDGGAEATTIALAATTLPDAADYELQTAAGTPPGPANLAAESAETAASTLTMAPGTRVAGEAAKAIEDFLANPASLFGAALPDLPACADAARVFLGEAARPSGALVPLDAGEAVVWFVSSDGTTVERLVLLDPVGCMLLASHP
jgi:hypothetical protein